MKSAPTEMGENTQVSIIGVRGVPVIKENDDVGKIISEAAQKQGTPFQDGDVIVVAQKIVSKAEGRIVKFSSVRPSKFASMVSKMAKKKAELVELILMESKAVVRMSGHHLITETKQGWVCANSAVDVSNVSGGDSASLLPENPDESASKIRRRVRELTDKDVAVIISDTFGRPLRCGHVDVAIGVSGINPFFDRRGEKDLFGYVLRVKQVAVVDELASAAELAMGQAGESVPVAIIRGYRYARSETARATDLIRPKEKDLFL